MEKDTGGDLGIGHVSHSQQLGRYFLKIPVAYFQYIAQLRKWEHLTMAKQAAHYWVTGFCQEQISSSAVMTIPGQRAYYLLDDKLVPLGAKVPVGKKPELLWVPIRKAIPVTLPKYNHNYFGVQQNVGVQIVQDSQSAPQPTYALLSPLATLASYTAVAAAVRLQHLQWAMVGEQALIIGVPTLPIQGQAYWCYGNFLIPVGYQFRHFLITDVMVDMLGAGAADWVVWHVDSTYTLVGGGSIRQLGRSSVRLTKRRVDDGIHN